MTAGSVGTGTGSGTGSGSASGRAGGVGTGALPPAAPGTSTAMIGVPTSTVWPSETSSAATTPAYGLGSSTTALAVSMSTMIWLMITVSPGLTRQATMSASVSPSPTSGSRNSRRCVVTDSVMPALSDREGAVDGV